MARRAQQGSVARCPYCDASLPQVAAECPQCRFPLTMDAADFGFRAPDSSGTTSTATTGGRSVPPYLRSGLAASPRVHDRRGHRMRMVAWMLGVMAILLLVAGVATLFTAISPDARSDREAVTSLATRFRRETVDPDHNGGLLITVVGADEASDRPARVSEVRAGDLWFGAARSTSGRCYMLASRLTGGPKLGETLGEDQPCTAGHARDRLESELRKTKP